MMIFDPLGRPPSATSINSQADRAFVRRIVATVGIGLLLAGASSTAFAAPGDTATGDTQANVQVESAITLTALTEDFTLTGMPGATVSEDGIVTMNVETNSFAGYSVTVQSASATLDANDPTNADFIPIGALSVRETGGGNFLPLSEATAVLVGGQGTRSADGGDTISNDYSVEIPFVNEDTYSAILNYVATTL